jgi:YrbI family 3-deoxy-D-manno-octulosonate 8-phosphate phosphatase
MNLESLNRKLARIKMLVMDVDGTMTDGGVYYTKDGEDVKRFSIRDGMGILLLKKAGIIPAIITSENSPIVIARAVKLKIEEVVLGSRNKKMDLMLLAEKSNLGLEEVAFIGDDINDIQALEIAGLSVCPANSVDSVKEIADYVCETDGGQGAIREIAEKILISQNKSIILPENW